MQLPDPLDPYRLSLYPILMIAVGHTSVGVLVGIGAAGLLPAAIPLPAQVVAVGLIGIGSHYVMDLIPHGHYDYDMTKPSPRELVKICLDFVVPIVVIGLYLLFTHGFGGYTWLVGAGVFGAQLPDMANGLRKLGKLPSWQWLAIEGRLHGSTHWHNPKSPTTATAEGGRRLGTSDIWQVAMLAGAVFLLFK